MRLASSAPPRGLRAPARTMHAAGRKHSRKCALGDWAIAAFSFSMICAPRPFTPDHESLSRSSLHGPRVAVDMPDLTAGLEIK